MAVLEAFVYDPLINWRLMQADVVDTRRPESKSLLSVVLQMLMRCSGSSRSWCRASCCCLSSRSCSQAKGG